METAGIRIALAGDAMMARPIRSVGFEPFDGLRKILASTHARFVNLETLFHDYEHSPAAQSGGTYMRCPPAVVEDVKWLGFDLISTANNHAFDYGAEGLLTHLSHLDRHGLDHAGSGENLAEASRPAYVDTSRGRVALVAAVCTAPSSSVAGRQGADTRGRPGVNPLRVDTRWQVDEEAYRGLERIADAFGWPEQELRRRSLGIATLPPDLPNEVRLHDHDMYSSHPYSVFVAGDSFAERTEVNPEDAARMLSSVDEAASGADWVLVSIHSHDSGRSADVPPEYITRFAHRLIDAGAHAIVVHGPHEDRGIEIYRHRPIIYGLGNFIFQTDSVDRVPADELVRRGLPLNSSVADYRRHRTAGGQRGPGTMTARWQSVLAVAEFGATGGLKSLALHPVDLGRHRHRAFRGLPMLASADVEAEVAARIQARSAPFGTVLRRDESGRLAVVPRTAGASAL